MILLAVLVLGFPLTHPMLVNSEQFHMLILLGYYNKEDIG